MSLEIERKWLVKELPSAKCISANRIIQGYVISNEKESVRVRCIVNEYDADYEATYKMTIKTGSGLVRNETEFNITCDQYDELWKLTKGKRIQKTRYVYDIGNGFKAELDIFDMYDFFALVEVEFPDEETANNFQALEWFGEEVTHDPKYINANLAR